MLAHLFAAVLLAQATPFPRPTAPPTPPPLATPVPTATPSPEPIESPEPGSSPESAASPVPSATPTPTGPQLTVTTNQVNLNPAQQRTVSVSGASTPLSYTLDQKLVQVAVDPTGTSVTITATQATGSDTLHLVDANGARADIAIKVAFNAGTIVPQTNLKVTGNPVDPTWLAKLVKGVVTRLTLAQPETQTTIGSSTTPVAPLASGATAQLTLPVTITSPTGQYFDQTGTTVVNVQNVGLDAFLPALLFYDDDPEHVTQDGVLFRGTVQPNQPARLYYYHDNANDPRRIVVILAANSQDPTSVQVIDASNGPNIDVMSVGHAVTRDFMLTKARNQGIVFDLPQDEPYALHDVGMTSRQGVAGNIDFRILSGGAITVTVMTVSPGVDPRTLLTAAPLPDDGHHRNGVFALANFGNDTLAFTVGSPDVKVVIGDREPTPPSTDPNAPGRDYGDYGVLHTIDATLNNPTDTDTTAYLYFRPIAGIARASFLVDGTLVELGCVRVPTPYQISAFPLAPHATVHTLIQTMTDGGSFYPVEIGLTATPPQPGAPPISAPDGCFPKPSPPAASTTGNDRRDGKRQ